MFAKSRSVRRVVVMLLLAMCAVASWSASPGYKDTLVVAADGTGDCLTVTEAFEHCRAFMDYEVHVLVRPGVYREKVILPSWLQNIVVEGEDAARTVIMWDDHAALDHMGTFRTYTLRVDGSGITFRNLTIANMAEPVAQAVALHTEGDRIAFIHCCLIGNQDTVFTGRGDTRLFFSDCYIEGTTDFIFGPATAWFERCTIHCKRRSYITAASTPADVPYGYVFSHCRLTYADGVQDVRLGRPWRDHASTVFLHCDLGSGIAPDGWAPWDVPHPEQTVRYAEYGCTGASASTRERQPWARVLSADEAAAITPEAVLGNWKVNEE